MEELKPCPFCGEKVEIDFNPYSKIYFIACENYDCNALVSVNSDNIKEVIKYWNRRV